MAPHKPVANAMEIDRLATQLAKDPQSKAFLPLAEEYCKVGMWEEAVGVLEDGLKYYPGFITAMVVLGRAYDQLNQPTKARAVLEGAVKLSPENLRAHRILIKIYAAQGLTEEALKSCRVILTMNPKDAEARAIQASLGVQEPEQPASGTKKRSQSKGPKLEDGTAKTSTASSQAPDSRLLTPSVAPVQEPPSEQVASSLPAAAESVERSPRHAETIAQLETWLRSLQQQRRDRPASDTPDFDP